jgi:hypothetical protein
MSRALSKIKAAGFVVELEGGQLFISPFSKLTQDQIDFIKTNRSEIIEALEREQTGLYQFGQDASYDLHHCRECRRLINGRCLTQRFRPVDDLPRRCVDYKGIG